MERLQIEEAFITLKPLCDSLMKNPNVKTACEIANILPKISDKVITDLFEYIIFPFIIHLSNDKLSKNIKEELIKTVQIIILKAKISKVKYFNELYSCLLIQIYDKTQPTMVIKEHEELKEAVLSCLKILINSCFTDVLEIIYVRQNASKIGQGLLLSITIGRIEKSKHLKLKAVETIMTLCQVDDKSNKCDAIWQNQVADIIMFFLPGIICGLQEIVIGNETQGYKLTKMALRAWGRIVSLVMKDKIQEDEIPSLNDLIKMNNEKNINPIEYFPKLKDCDELEKHLKSTTRNKEWFNASATKLNILIQQLNILKRHSHYKVRKEFVENIHLILTSCPRNMKPNIMLLIDYLISLSEDEFAVVSKKAEKTLSIINTNFMQNKNMKSLIELLEDNFYNLLTKLPRIIRKSDDNDQLACLNQIAGYLKLLGEQRLPHIMMSASHIHRLILSLIYVSEIDCTNVSLLQAINVKDLDDPTYSYGSNLWKRFKFIQTNACELKFITICKYLGEFGDLRILIDNIFSLMFNVPQYRKELILLLNWIIYVPVKDSSILPLYKEVVEFYINPEFWYPIIEINDDTPLRVAQNNVIQCCLLLEGLGLIAQNLKYNYDKFLLKTLYLVIERAGSAHSLISFVGTQTLEQIAKSQQNNTIGDLLRANIDYLSYHISIKLRRVERNPDVLDVIEVIMKYSTMDVLPCLKEIVEDVILQLNNSFQKKNSYAFLKVFYTFTICIKNLASSKHAIISELNIDTKNESSKIIQSFLEYYEAKKVDEDIDNIEQSCEFKETKKEEKEKLQENIKENEYETNFMEQEGKDKNMPSYIKMIEDIMKHCLHFLPSKEIQKSLIAMLTLQKGLEILANWENQLLPIVHLLWHPLVDRFYDENILIINRAWQLLNMLSYVSKDFIRSRTLKQVLPALSKFLCDSSKESYNKSSDSIYKFTQIYKLQRELLSSLGQITKNLCLHERETLNILSIAEPYLNKHQNPTLQAYCIKLYKDVADYNSDIVWIKCLSIFNSKITRIISDATFDIKDLMITENNSSNDYIKNVQIILNYIQDKSINNF